MVIAFNMAELWTKMSKYASSRLFVSGTVYTSLIDADMHKLLGRNTLLHTWIHQRQLHTRSKFTTPDTLNLDSKSMVLATLNL